MQTAFLEMNNVYAQPAYAAIRRRLKQHLLDLKAQLDDEDGAYPELEAVHQRHFGEEAER